MWALRVKTACNSTSIFRSSHLSSKILTLSCFAAWTVCILCVAHPSFFSPLLSIHVCADHPLCVSVPPHDVKRMAWNSTVNSSCPDSDHSQSSVVAAPLGSNAVAAKSNTKPSKTTSALTNQLSLFSSHCSSPKASVSKSHLWYELWLSLIKKKKSNSSLQSRKCWP